ncbi:growth arrest and DNA damage-inducible proteins-interacting protein 1 [Adelges cooleyi]|uniref:growth arrest and DNA damage-inducible proteins-interacting protein 1 n=1 Tax=Adelges cooleyi TaxID=133065 RepID=UPI00217FF176|nr:growth arrest and DNA damage-inducible proteins-interacting protein 1 [Adelges cooleyi]
MLKSRTVCYKLGISTHSGWIPFVQCSLSRAASTNVQEAREIVETTRENTLSDKEVERICNKSRLNDAHRNLVNGRVPYDTPVQRFHNTVKYKRRMYGRYGSTSGVDPGLAWPTAEDLEDIREYENVAHPSTIQDMYRHALERVKKEQQEIQTRQKQIDENFKKLNGWLKEVKDKAAKKLQEAQEAKNKKARLIEEVRKHFGYKLDPKDERFKEMLAKREKEEKKKIRDEKKKIREEKMLNYIKSSESSSENKK